ncbi:MAG: DUF222 domain-containing protein [Dermatophilaceae bacterium]
MNRGGVSDEIVELRARCAALGRRLVEEGSGLSVVEAFEVAGELQGLANAAEGAQAVVLGWGARVEERPVAGGVVERVHPVGFTSEMSVSMACLETGVSEGLAGRKVRLGASLGERFPKVRDLLVAGELPAATAHKILDACDGLDVHACAKVDEQLASRLVGLDPAAVTRAARSVASRVAADQVAARIERSKRGRYVQVRPGVEDGLAEISAVLPTEIAAVAWSAVEQVAADYCQVDPALSVDQARADAFGDLLLRNVAVSATVTLGVPVLTGAAAGTGPAPTGPALAGRSLPGPSPAGPSRAGSSLAGVDQTAGNAAREPRAKAGVSRDDGDVVREPRARARVNWADGDVVHIDHATGETVTFGELDAAGREAVSWVEVPDVDDPVGGAPHACSVDSRYQVMAPVGGGCAVSGAEIPGVGWVDAATVAALFTAVPVQVARAVLDAGTGTLASLTTNAYAPTTAMREFVHTRDGTCRMWGCTRRATHTDLDHTKPWPVGSTSPSNLVSLCRRHHRMKQHGRWRYTLEPDGDITWISQSGTTRRTHPAHRVILVPPCGEEPPGTPCEPTRHPTPDTLDVPASAAGVFGDAAADALAVPVSAIGMSGDAVTDADPPPESAAGATRAVEPSPVLDLPPF